jgi:hypothetical protein
MPQPGTGLLHVGTTTGRGSVENQYLFFDTRRGCRLGLLIGSLFIVVTTGLAMLLPGPGWFRIVTVLVVGAMFVPLGWWLEHRRDSARRR